MIMRLQLANALMFVPLGLLHTFIARRARVGHGAAAGLGLSLFVEAAQYAMNTGRTVDVDDVLFNTLGSLPACLPHRIRRRGSPARHAR